MVLFFSCLFFCFETIPPDYRAREMFSTVFRGRFIQSFQLEISAIDFCLRTLLEWRDTEDSLCLEDPSEGKSAR